MQGEKMNIKLNCDMGEGFGIWKSGHDEELMPFVQMANLACGFHASDPYTMAKSVRLATTHNVEIGAHPGYPDLVGFGRRSMVCSLEEIKSIVIYQMGALDGMCKAFNSKITYVKPHGALYNDMMKDENIFKAIVSAVSAYDANIKLMILSSNNNEHYAQVALSYGVSLLFEVFADRNYNDDGSLVSRAKSDAIIHDELDVIDRIRILNENGFIYSKNGKRLFLKANTICVHSDNPNAVEFVKNIRKSLD
jgi:UPF0271 protein